MTAVSKGVCPFDVESGFQVLYLYWHFSVVE